MDTLTPEQRSLNMSKIRSKNTTPEITVRSLLHSLGLRFRLHRKDLAGRPDVVLPKYRIALFVHGCFWHRHQGCRQATTPKTRTEFWLHKFEQNVLRDKAVRSQLEDQGWRVVIVWECEARDLHALKSRLQSSILGNSPNN